MTVFFQCAVWLTILSVCYCFCSRNHRGSLSLSSRCLVPTELFVRIQRQQGGHDSGGSGSRPNFPCKQDTRRAHMHQCNIPPQASDKQHRQTQHRRHTWQWIRSCGKLWRQCCCWRWPELRDGHGGSLGQGSLPGYVQTARQSCIPRLLPDLACLRVAILTIIPFSSCAYLHARTFLLIGS